MTKRQEGNLLSNERGPIEGSPEGDMTSLFFRVLYDLGVYVADWETWYGTRPLVIPGAEGRPAPLQHTTHPSANR